MSPLDLLAPPPFRTPGRRSLGWIVAEGHPASLSGWELPAYLRLLRRAREHTHSVLAGWTDASLEDICPMAGRSPTRGWVLYHLLEHFAYHSGQIFLLLALHRRAG